MSEILVKCICIALSLLVVEQVIGACIEDEWECDNGDCISTGERCDGTIDCKDNSDEIASNCIHKKCPPYAFRCAYGACVRGGSQCDGQVDCADKSDELPRLCGNETEFEIKLRGACGELEMQCSPGSCIGVDRKCDGIRDCANGIDETVELCGLRKCATYAFQCGYGACLYAGVYCNNTEECLDRSDESYKLCGYKRVTNDIDDSYDDRLQGTSTRSSISIITTKLPPTGNSSWCGIPTDYPYLLITDVFGHIINEPIKKGSIVFYSCSGDYELVNSGLNGSYCVGPNLHRINSCEKRCDASVITGDFSKSASCQYGFNTYDCEDAKSVRPGTEATLKCATYFYPSSRKKLEVRQQCTADGKWAGFSQDCTMYCGTTVETFPLAANAIDVSNSEIPWHVGIYVQYNQVHFNYTCGGTIISPIVILTAAHCVYDIINGTTRSPDEFQVIASKFFKNYYKGESGSQTRNVLKIIEHSNYKHFDLYQNDLALLVLEKHLTFGRTIRPICIDRTNDFTDGNGQLGAWGSSENLQFNKYEVLQVIDGEHYDYDSCYKQQKTEVLTAEKFCVKSYHGLACRGDSGGGYFIYNNKTNKFHLIGVLSNALSTDTSGCARTDTFLYLTDVYKFKDWINDLRIKEELDYKVRLGKAANTPEILTTQNNDSVNPESKDEDISNNIDIKLGKS